MEGSLLTMSLKEKAFEEEGIPLPPTPPQNHNTKKIIEFL
jgi:hypothetical protein